MKIFSMKNKRVITALLLTGLLMNLLTACGTNNSITQGKNDTAGTADHAGNTVNDVANDVGNTVNDVADDVGNTVHDVAKDVADGAKDLADDAKDTADDLVGSNKTARSMKR